MTCPHLKFAPINNAKGSNIIAAAAYNARRNIFDETDGCMKYPRTHVHDHVLTKMLLPDGAPKSYFAPERIWNDLNKIGDKRIGYRLIIPFQKELSFDENMKLATELLNREFVSKGHAVQLDVHRGRNGNDHMHVLVSDRRLVNGHWDSQKSNTVYYLRGTVKVDDKGRITNPDTAVLLTDADKIPTPKLLRKKLQYDSNGNIITEPGWQRLKIDEQGNPLLDKNGCPILIDIREPDYVPGTRIQKVSKNGKYKKPQWKKATIKHSDITDIGNIARIRKTWQDLQNEAFIKNGITDSNGNILSVDLRSYREQNKERAADDQLIPTRHVFEGKVKPLIMEYNKNVRIIRDANKSIKEITRKKEHTDKALSRAKSALVAIQDKEFKFFNRISPRQSFISSYTTSYEKVMQRKRIIETTFLRMLDKRIKVNISEYNKTDNSTKRGSAKKSWLSRHAALMSSYKLRLGKIFEESWDITPVVSDVFDRLTNKDIVSFICSKYGRHAGNVAARVLTDTRPDSSNPHDGNANASPYYPKNDTDIAVLRVASSRTTGKPDINDAMRNALDSWENRPFEAPPVTALRVLDACYTAEGYFMSKLTGNEWYETVFTSETPEQINLDYQQEIINITNEERPEQQTAQSAELPTEHSREEHEAEYKRLSMVRDNTLEEIITIANDFSDKDIHSITTRTGAPYRAGQLKLIQKMLDDGRLPEHVQTSLEALIDRRKHEADDAKDYYDKYLKTPASIAPATPESLVDLTPDEHTRDTERGK